MGNSVGTPKKIAINGVTYDMPADAKFSYNPSLFDIEAQQTTGDALFKYTKRSPIVEIELSVTPAQLMKIKDVSNTAADATFSNTLADGSVFKATGRLKLDNYEGDSGKIKITMIPKKDWTPFLAD